MLGQSQGNREGGAERAEEALLQEMYDDFGHGNESVKPDAVRSFDTVLDAWSKSASPEALEQRRDEHILSRRMLEHIESGELHDTEEAQRCKLQHCE